MSQLTQNTTDLDALIAKANALPDAGSGGGAAVEYEIITIPAGATTATYTLPRVTTAFGSLAESVETIYNSNITNAGYIYIMSICDTLSRGIYEINSNSSLEINSDMVTYHNGVVSLSGNKVGAKFKLLLVNDPNANAISY